MKFLITLFILMPGINAFGASKNENLIITPIVGVERVQKFEPTVQMKTRAIFGVRGVFKLPIAALEGEVTRGQDTSTDLTTSTNYKDVEDKAKLGLRGGFELGQFFSTYIRGGAQGRQNTQTKTVGGVSTSKKTLSKVQPYVGVGIDIKLMQYFSLSADLTATHTPTDDPKLKDYELQPSLGFNLRF
jgi:hypothetical protein